VSPSLDLKEVVEAAFRHNPTVEAVRARRGEAEALKRQADSFIAGDAVISVDHHDDRGTTRKGYQEWDSGLTLPIWLPGQRDARHRVAERTGQAAVAAERQLRHAVAGMVREGLWRIALLENAVTSAKAEWEATAKLAADVRRRVELGDMARIDLLLAEQETLDRRAIVVRAQEDHWHAIHNYQIFTGLEALPRDHRESQAAVKDVTPSHPALLDAGASREVARARRDLAQRERSANPTVLLGSKHEMGAYGDTWTNSLVMEVHVPLGLPSQAAPRIATSERELAETDGEYEKRWREIRLAIDGAAHEIHTVAQEADLAKRQAGLAAEHLRMARQAFALGESDLVSLVRVQKATFAAERRLQQKLIEQGLAVARYNQAVGEIP
jgi:outer membrane protein TolC